MKTIILKTGSRSHKTGNTLLRGAAVVASVILLSFTVSAQGLWKQFLTYNSFGKMAIMMVNETDPVANSAESEDLSFIDATVYVFEQAYDDVLELEAWMADDAFFGTYKNLFEIEEDSPLELEDWMTNDAYFSNNYAEEEDGEFEIEEWMTSLSYWSL